VRDLLDRIRAFISQRTLRERWLVILVVCVFGFLIVHGLWVRPLQKQAAELDQEIESLEEQIGFSSRLVRNVRQLQAELAQVERLITSAEKSDLLSLLESLATQAGLTQEQIDSVTPKPASPNPRYPEVRVEVRLKGATLGQTVDFLYRIQTASQHLIVRSLRITTRGKEQQVLDVSFSVSSFERA
jgi:Tfp pilus assembly protein PilO